MSHTGGLPKLGGNASDCRQLPLSCLLACLSVYICLFCGEDEGRRRLFLVSFFRVFFENLSPCWSTRSLRFGLRGSFFFLQTHVKVYLRHVCSVLCVHVPATCIVVSSVCSVVLCMRVLCMYVFVAKVFCTFVVISCHRSCFVRFMLLLRHCFLVCVINLGLVGLCVRFLLRKRSGTWFSSFAVQPRKTKSFNTFHSNETQPVGFAK